MSTVSLSTVFDIKELYASLTGRQPAQVPGVPQIADNTPLAQIQPATVKTKTLYGGDLYGQADMLGHEVFCPATIEVDGVDYFFPFVVIGIDRVKNIVITELTEVNSSVKEVIGNKDIEITIKGFLIGEYEQFPDDKLAALNKAFEHNQNVRLKASYSDIFLRDGDEVLITRLTIPPKPGVIGVRDFSLQLISDHPFTLYKS